MSANRISDVDNNDFADSGASLTTPIQCSQLKVKGYVVLKNRPCRIVEMHTAKTGKHGHSKVNLVGIDIFNGRKYEEVWPSSHIAQVPEVLKKEYNVNDIICLKLYI